MKQENYPDLGSVADMGAQEYLVALYKGLGWDGQSALDPRKIAINQQRWLDVCNEYNQLPGPGIGGYFWMNYGPSESADLPYNSVKIEPGAFGELDMDKVMEEDRTNIDQAIQGMYRVADGNVIELETDPSADDSFLLGKAYDYRRMEPEDFDHALKMDIYEDWVVPTDITVDYILEEAGIQPHDMDRYEAGREYVMGNYDISPPCDELIGQEAKVNILLGTPEEANLDFSSIHDMSLGMADPDVADEDVRDNALTWLTEQQGYDYDSLADAVDCQQNRGFSACMDMFGPFLASASSELNNFSNVMGTVTVLTRMPIADIPKLNAPGYQITVPEGSTVGIFAPWIGGGSMLNIELEKPLAIPSEMIFETQIEGVRCDAYTVNQVYGLADEAWKGAVDIEACKGERDRPLDDLVKEAKERAGEKSVQLKPAGKEKSPELGL